MESAITNKLILLFVLDKMEIPITEQTMLDLCTVDNDWLNYMECRDTLDQLVEAGFVYAAETSESGTMFHITPDGRICLAHFFVKIHSSLREEITEYIRVNRLKYRKKQEYRSDYFKNPDGTYTVVLKIQEPGRPIMELRLLVPDRHKAKTIYRNWCNDAPRVYSSIYSTLVE
ncbi:MAG: DUF4364 family protein [Clostridia bacterium]|jgi:Fe2+ or Zn2+ uptake regulation protein|nr:DUF4364 family protein [Clostridia bacterium]MBR7160629.1 DUF4364 family protein [Clostridia bacterium]